MASTNSRAHDGIRCKNTRPSRVRIDNDDMTAANGCSTVRFLICVLGLIGLAMSQMSRSVLNITITDMVRIEAKKDTAKGIDQDSCPWPVEEQEYEPPREPDAGVSEIEGDYQSKLNVPSKLDDNQTQEDCSEYQPQELDTTTMKSDDQQGTMYLEDNSKKTSEIITESDDRPERERSKETTSDDNQPKLGGPQHDYGTVIATLQSEEDYQQKNGDQTEKSEILAGNASTLDTFDWTVQQRTRLLGAFFYSYPVFMIAGGWIAETHGVKYVLLTSVAGSGLINLLTPWMARNSFGLLFFSRIVMGAIQAGAFPAMYALFNEWLTMSEASIFAPLIKVNLRLGALLGTGLSGIVAEWPNVFYSAGYVSLIWSILWMIFATSQPKDSNWVSKLELAHIMRKKLTKLKDLNSSSNKKKSTPWLKIITAPSVLALIIIKLTFNFGIDFVVILLPTYLKAVHHMSRTKVCHRILI